MEAVHLQGGEAAKSAVRATVFRYSVRDTDGRTCTLIS